MFGQAAGCLGTAVQCSEYTGESYTQVTACSDVYCIDSLTALLFYNPCCSGSCASECGARGGVHCANCVSDSRCLPECGHNPAAWQHRPYTCSHRFDIVHCTSMHSLHDVLNIHHFFLPCRRAWPCRSADHCRHGRRGFGYCRQERQAHFPAQLLRRSLHCGQQSQHR